MVWGVAYLAEAAARVIIVETTSTGTALTVSKVMPYVVAAALFAWMFAHGRHARRIGERLAAASAAASDVRLRLQPNPLTPRLGLGKVMASSPMYRDLAGYWSVASQQETPGLEPQRQVTGSAGQPASSGRRTAVMEAVVLGQHVVAEIVRRVPPRRMDVGAVSLRVVVLDEQGRALHPVVVPVAG